MTGGVKVRGYGLG